MMETVVELSPIVENNVINFMEGWPKDRRVDERG